MTQSLIPPESLDNVRAMPPECRRFVSLHDIGLGPALHEVERLVNAAGGSDRVDMSGAPHWQSLSVDHHTAKAVGHLGRHDAGEIYDPDLSIRVRTLANVAARALMALGVELAEADDVSDTIRVLEAQDW